jgi:leucyl aminopeptidase
MDINIFKTANLDAQVSVAVIAGKDSVFDVSFLSGLEYNYVKQCIDKGDNYIIINQYHRLVFIAILDPKKPELILLEDARKAGYKLQVELSAHSFEKVIAFHAENNSQVLLAFTEGAILGSYKFTKYQKINDDKKTSLKEFGLICQPLTEESIAKFVNVNKALYKVRDLVNEPVSFLNAEQLSREFEEMAKESGFGIEVLNKSKIEALKMGGLIAVNKGSVDPPTFTIMEWKPDNPINQNPYVLVGKGVVYDTGGLSLKPTSDSMDYMKCDMSGAAIVAGVLYAIAKNKLPVHVIALAPATDNRPSGNAFAPGDIITMMDGTNVEMLNSDAEGRMILADALVYAKKFNPELVIDVATLTGSASAAIGTHALVAMGNAPQDIKNKLVKSGEYVFERIVEFPLWDDFAESLKSDIADIKNVGGKQAGAITAGKFLEKFVSYPWMHFDIAGVAFSKKNDNYRGKGGTGFGMRLLYDFFFGICQK